MLTIFKKTIAMKKDLQNHLNTISIISKERSPKKRTITECARVVSCYGEIVDYEKHSMNDFRFFIDIKREQIFPLLNNLKQVEYFNKDINMSDISVNELPYRTPTRFNIYLTIS
jgi:hypothetical protein